jgi:membrane protease YdiL (CAAX protease family)
VGEDTERPTNSSLLFPYVAPILVYVGTGSIPDTWLEPSYNYALRLVATAAVLVFFWRRYAPLCGPGSAGASIGIGVAAGLAGAALWVVVKAPFYPGGGEPWDTAAFVLRIIASGTVVAIFEEILFRGYVLRLAVQWEHARRAGAEEPFAEAFGRGNIADVEPGAWTPLAVAIATLAFTAGHAFPGEYPAAIVYGLLMAGLWIWRKDLLTCVIAHGVSNVAVGLYGAQTGHWAAW